MNLLTGANLLYLVLAAAVIVGGFFGLRYGIAHTAQEVQERVINALKADNERLEKRVNDLETENTALKAQLKEELQHHTRLMKLVVVTLKKIKNIDLEIDRDNDIITVRNGGGSAIISSIQDMSGV